MPDRRARRHEATRREILEAAWDLARERGLTGWTLREVASAVDMRAPSLYAYFASKEAIYDAMFAQGYEQLLARIETVPPGGDAASVLRRAAQTFFDFGVEDSARFYLLFQRVVPGFTPSSDAYGLAEQVFDRLRREFAIIGITDAAAIDLWTAMVTGLVSQQVSNEPGGDRWARLVDHASRMFLASELPTH